MLEQRVVQWTEEWKQEGRREGLGEVLLRQVEWKFGEVPAWVRERVDAADTDQLLEWSTRILTAKCLGDVFEV